MNQFITQDDLIRYAYNETSAEENIFIRQAIETDLKLQEDYHDMLIGQTMLDLLQLSSPANHLLVSFWITIAVWKNCNPLVKAIAKLHACNRYPIKTMGKE